MASTEEIKKQRELANQSRIAASAATATAEQHRKALESMVCKQAGVSAKYLDLVRTVIADPLTGACMPAFDRILATSFQKGVIVHVHGGIHAINGPHGSSGNAWYELGPVGVQMMTDIEGDDWHYDRPSAQFKDEQESQSPRMG